MEGLVGTKDERDWSMAEAAQIARDCMRNRKRNTTWGEGMEGKTKLPSLAFLYIYIFLFHLLLYDNAGG